MTEKCCAGCKVKGKMHRVYKEKGYCSRCYGRLFKRMACSGCGAHAKLFKEEKGAICQSCERKKPCIRCGKAEYKLGKFTQYGPVCNSCSLYFRETGVCGGCGVQSQRLSRISRFGNDLRLCLQCATSDYGTCQACRRYRLLAVGPDGRLLCTACGKPGENACPTCGQPVPGGRKHGCEACYWRKTFFSRLNMDRAVFVGVKLRDAFDQFGQWLIEETGAQKAALKLHRYLDFFTEIEKHWGAIPAYEVLVAHFGPDGLRRVRLPMRWMAEKNIVQIDQKMRDAESEKRIIATLLAKLDGQTPFGKAVLAYHGFLQNRLQSGGTTLRSLRLALTPTVALALSAQAGTASMLSQGDLDAYLVQSPGQVAAVTGFVNWLNSTYGLGLVLNGKRTKVVLKRQESVEQKIIALLQAGPDSDDFAERWMVLGLTYFQGLNERTAKHAVKNAVVTQDGEKITITWDGHSYCLPRFTKKAG